MEIRLSEANTVIFLDFNRFICIQGVIKRWLTHLGKTRADMTEGCPEKIDFGFLKWVWQYPAISRPKTIEKISKYKGVELIIIKNRRMLKRFISEII